jgi:hypothetical protein
MALYRFLFAPVLLAVAVLAGSHGRTASGPPARPEPVAGASGSARSAEVRPVAPAGARASAVRPAPGR